MNHEAGPLEIGQNRRRLIREQRLVTQIVEPQPVNCSSTLVDLAFTLFCFSVWSCERGLMRLATEDMPPERSAKDSHH